MTSCGKTCMKNLLYIFNVIFAIFGVCLKVAGTIALENTTDFYYFLDTRVVFILITLVATGVAAVVIGYLGCMGASKESCRALIVFIALLLVTLGANLGAVVAVGHVTSDVTEQNMRQSMFEYRSTQADREAWDMLQAKLQCCGVDNADDWKSVISPTSNQARQLPLYPGSCYTCLGAVEAACGVEGRGPVMQEGCLVKVTTRLRRGAAVVMGLGIAFTFIELICMAVACSLVVSIKKGEAHGTQDEEKILKHKQ